MYRIILTIYNNNFCIIKIYVVEGLVLDPERWVLLRFFVGAVFYFGAMSHARANIFFGFGIILLNLGLLNLDKQHVYKYFIYLVYYILYICT